ncbi:unnamed protein product [Microthlaspi erraticum]|uniref:F-box domain-containing protein n=1 Tax=Microthlaspi erraticum TaxID=1685480 RepID=A0A6D2IJC0_9BRAS|nr:unnamed protein product [Microthlaspi erraticum]
MEDRKAKGKAVKGSAGFSSAGEDLISKLPDSLISQVLLYIPTKEAVRTSVLSNRWKRVWLLIPEFDLDSSEFSDYNAFVRFMDRLLGFCRKENSCLHKLKLSIRKDGNDQSCVTRWIDFVATPKLKHLDVECPLVKRECLEVMPLSLYVCETLVYLRLHRVSLVSFESVSLPRVKTMRLEENVFANEAGLELLISSCPLLDDLSIVRRSDDIVKVVRVRSQTLTSLSLEAAGWDDDDDEGFDHENSGVLIDAPRLKYLNFEDEVSHSKIIGNLGSLTKVNLLGSFYLWDDLQRRNFFTSISGVKDMKIFWQTSMIMGTILPLPQFRNLSCLEAGLYVNCLQILPAFLESFPNLKSLTLVVLYSSRTEEIRLSLVPQCLLSSLKFVEIKGMFWGEPIMEAARRYEGSPCIGEAIGHVSNHSLLTVKMTLKISRFATGFNWRKSFKTLNPSAQFAMEESFSKEKGKCGEGSAGFSSGGEDLISKLPDSLISQILSDLPTKEAVRTSVLSNRWKSLWRLIPVLDLASSELPDYDAFVSFVDRFLGFYREDKPCFHKLKLVIQKDEDDQHCVTRWIDFAATPKLKHLHVDFGLLPRECMEVMPLSLYVCETLLHLTLNWVSLGSFKSVSLPRLKTMRLEANIYANEASLQLLISSCPVLEDLNIVRRPDDNVMVLRVHSQTLTSVSMRVGGGHDDDEVYIEDFDFEGFAVLIDAPRLKYLTFDYELSPIKVISNSGCLTKVSLLGCLCLWDDLATRNFVASISGVKDMNICYDTFEIIKSIMPLPQFCNLSCLEAAILPDSLGSLPKFLESFPNLETLILHICDCSLTLKEEIRLSLVPQCLLSSLGSVELKTSCCGTPTKMQVARYFAKNAVMLKKLVLHVSTLEEKSVVLRDLLALPRRSSTYRLYYKSPYESSVYENPTLEVTKDSIKPSSCNEAIRGCPGLIEESFSKKKRKTVKGSAGFLSAREDLISNLPDSLISEILSYLPTKEAVRTSVLSRSWKNLWLSMPVLDLATYRHSDKNALHCVTRWIDFVATRKLKHLDVEFGPVMLRMEMEVTPLSLYVCETLVYLRLHRVLLCSFKSVSLPRLKTMRLEANVYANELILELLISSCPVLEDLSIVRIPDDNAMVLRVHSQTLTSLSVGYPTNCYLYFGSENPGVLIDAPRLKNLCFQDEQSPSKIISNSSSLTNVNILGDFDLWDSAAQEGGLQKLDMIRTFFTSISGVRDMKISRDAFQNVKCDGREEIRLSLVPQCLLSSLEFVEIKSATFKVPFGLKLARYFAENAVMLKRLVMHSRFNSVREEDILALPRRSSSCQIVYVSEY